MEFSTLINWTSPFPFKGLLGVFSLYYSNFKKNILLELARLIKISVNRSINKSKNIIDMNIQKSVTFNGCSIYLFI